MHVQTTEILEHGSESNETGMDDYHILFVVRMLYSCMR